MLSLALIEGAFCLDDDLLGLFDFAESEDFAGLAAGLFLFVWAVLGVSRPPGFCAKAGCEKMRMEKMEETKETEVRR
jgi:hypothetical protein